jgi:hypothetical protein
LAPRIPKISQFVNRQINPITPRETIMMTFSLINSILGGILLILSGCIANKSLAQKIPNTGNTQPVMADKTVPIGMRIYGVF